MTAGRSVSRVLFRRTVLLGLLALSATLDRHSTAAEAYSEDSVRAAYIYRFAGYVVWPDPGPPNAPFTIDVMGSPGVARELRRMLTGHTINDRSAQVREISSLKDIGKAQILYVADGYTQTLRQIRPRTTPDAMLLVTAEEDGLDSGSAINFLTVDRNVRFEVSLPAAKRWGLKISADLLGVAARVQGGRSDD